MPNSLALPWAGSFSAVGARPRPDGDRASCACPAMSNGLIGSLERRQGSDLGTSSPPSNLEPTKSG